MQILWVVFCLAAVFGLLFLFLYVMKRISNGVSVVSGSKMRVLDRVSVGRDGMLLVVSVAGKLMLISATPQHIDMLCELEMSPEEYAEQLIQQGQQNSFAAVLASAVNRKSEKDNGNDKEND